MDFRRARGFWRFIAFSCAFFFCFTAEKSRASDSLARFDDWIAYRVLSEGGDGFVCAASSRPQSSDSADGDGRLSSGAAFVVRLRGGTHELAFRLKEGSSGGGSEIRIGKARYPAVGGDERNPRWAWAANPEDSSRILRDMKKGYLMRVLSVSQSGRRDWDRYSLRGVTAALAFLEARCGSDALPPDGA